jgi:hypothetical protein
MATVTPESLFTGDHGPVMRPGTVAANQDLEAYSVLGIVTETGQFALVDKDAEDGSQTAKAILPVALDTTEGAASTDLVRHGEVDEDLLVFAEGTDIDDCREQLIAAGIYPVARR